MVQMIFFSTIKRLRRNVLFPIACVIGGISSAGGSQTTFPYVAYVSEPQTFARGGPGQQYYPTQQLAQGHAVEVYRHDVEGWCAVRPPEGSFCWVAAHEIHRLDQMTAEIAVEHAIARVGSNVSPARSAVQVMLQRGEKVQLLPAGAHDDPRWVRIAPPDGEFRWLAASSLSRTPPYENSGGVKLAAGWMSQSNPRNSLSTKSHSDQGFAHLVQNTVPVQPPFPGANAATPSLSPMPNSGDNAPEFEPGGSDEVEVVTGSPAAAQVLQSPELVSSKISPLRSEQTSDFSTATVPRASTSPRIRFGSSPSVLGPATDRVQELQLRLSQTVIRPKEEWRFEQLEAEATSSLEKSDSVSEREHLRDLLDRIARFQRVQKGFITSPEITGIAMPDPENGQFTGQTSRIRELAELDLKSNDPFERRVSNPDEPRYDAVGRLKPVSSQEKEAPRYALVDDKGAVVSFVTPTPDLNLRPYVGMRIGVNGSRGFIPEFRKAHVTAGRVTLIEDRIRR